MGGFTEQFVGLKELDAKLSALKTTEAHRIIKQGLLDGGEVIQAAVQGLAPERPQLPSGTALPVGALARDIELHFGKDEAGLPAAIVSPGKYTAYAARWVEYGHRLVKGGRLSMRRGKMRGSGQQIGEVPAHPFLRPGFEESQQEAVEVTVQSIASGIDRAMKK